MGGRGAYSSSGGFTSYEYEAEEDRIGGYKVIHNKIEYIIAAIGNYEHIFIYLLSIFSSFSLSSFPFIKFLVSSSTSPSLLSFSFAFSMSLNAISAYTTGTYIRVRKGPGVNYDFLYQIFFLLRSFLYLNCLLLMSYNNFSFFFISQPFAD